MIGKISHGNSFGDCLDYLTRVKQDKQPSEKRVWHIIDSDGVRLNVGEEAVGERWRHRMWKDRRSQGQKSKTRADTFHSVFRRMTATV